MRKLILAIVLGLGIALSAGTMAHAQASACSYGAIGYSHYYGPPGSGTVWLGTADNPRGCGQIRAEAWPQNGPHPVYSGWVKNPGIDATAVIPSSWPNPRLLRASEWREHTNGTHCEKRQFWPTLGSWVPCSASVQLTAAVMRHHACGSECLYYQGNNGVQPGWFRVKWVTNAGEFIRAVGKCGNGTRSTITKLGDWRTSVGIWSSVTCTSGYPNLTGAAYDIKRCAGCSYTRTWVTLPARPMTGPRGAYDTPV